MLVHHVPLSPEPNDKSKLNTSNAVAFYGVRGIPEKGEMLNPFKSSPLQGWNEWVGSPADRREIAGILAIPYVGWGGFRRGDGWALSVYGVQEFYLCRHVVADFRKLKFPFGVLRGVPAEGVGENARYEHWNRGGDFPP